MTEIGEGNLNWQDIIKACTEIGVEWALWNRMYVRGSFESLAISLNNLKKLGLNA